MTDDSKPTLQRSRDGSAKEPELEYAAWDTLKDLRFAWRWFVGATPNAARRARAVHRTFAYARAARGEAAPGPLTDDLARRRAMWERHLEDAAPDLPPTSPRGRWWLPDLLVFGFDELAWLAALIGIAVVIASGVVAVTLAVPWLVWHIARTRRRSACRRALADQHCPDCGYDLRGVPEAINPAELRGQRAGPTRCPECGSPWPLLPPPVR